MSRKRSRRRSPAATPGPSIQPPGGGGPVSYGLVLVVATTAVLPLVAGHINVHGTGTEFDGVQGLVWFGLVIVAAFCAALLDGVRLGELSLPPTGMLIGAGLLVVGAVVSGVVAENRYAALVGATQVVLAVLYFLAVLLVARGRNGVRWLLAALVAGAVAAAVVSLVDRAMVSPEVLMDYFNAYRLDILQARGIEPGSAEETLYRIRIRSDFIGTFYHPNLMACYMAMGLLVAAGIGGVAWAAGRPHVFQPDKRNVFARAWDGLASRFRTNPQIMVRSLLLAGLAALMVVPLVMTHARAALVADVAGLYVMLVLGLARSRGARALLLVVPGLVAAAILVLVLDSSREAPWLASLRFRWDYWRATWQLIRAHPWLGVGPGNFGDHYVTYKLATAPEEISHPHNAFLWAWSATGLAGLVGLVTLVGFGLREAVRRMMPLTEPLMSAVGIRRQAVPVALIVALLLVVFEFAGAGAAGPTEALLALLGVGLRMAALALPFAVVLAMGHVTDQALRNIGRKWIRCGLIAALVAFWLQAQVSLNVPHLPTLAASLCLVALLVATSQRGGAFRWRVHTRGRRSVIAAVVLIVVVAYMAFVAYPLVGSNWAAADARRLVDAPRASRESLMQARPRLETAAERCPSWDMPHVLMADNQWRLAEYDSRASYAESAERHLRSALSELDEALRRNPRNIGTLRKMVQLCARLADEHGAADMRSAALRHQGRIVELYPTKAAFRGEYARMLAAGGRPDEARRQARTAVELDDLMPDPLRKLDTETRADCERLARPDDA